MSQRSDELYQKILELRAKRKGVSREEAEKVERSKPFFLLAAEACAERRGVSPKEVLEADLQRMETCTYPTPECLTPDEIEDLIDAEVSPGNFGVQAGVGSVSSVSETVGLTEARLAHLKSCDACRTLLAASQPKRERRKEFERFLDTELSHISIRSESNQESVADLPPREMAKTFASDAVSAVVPPLLVLLVCYVFVVNPTVAIQRLSWLPWVAALISLIVAGYLAFQYFDPMRKGGPIGKSVFLRFSSGALVGGLVVGAITAAYISEQFRARQDITVPYQLAENKIAMLNAQLIRGAQFLLGTIEEVSSDSFVLRNSDGTRIRIKYGSSVSRPMLGSRVAVTFDVNSLTATKITELK